VLKRPAGAGLKNQRQNFTPALDAELRIQAAKGSVVVSGDLCMEHPGFFERAGPFSRGCADGVVTLNEIWPILMLV
jgi:hypothetical protein